MPDKSLHRYRFADFYRRSRQLACRAARGRSEEGRPRRDAQLESLRAFRVLLRHSGRRRRRAHAESAARARGDRLDRESRRGSLLIVDDVLLPLFEKFTRPGEVREDHRRAADRRAGAGAVRQLRGIPRRARRRGFEYPAHDEDDPIAMCYTSGTTGRPKGVVYSHRSMVLHTLVGNQPDHWGLDGAGQRVAGHADVSRELLGHSVRRGDDGHQASCSPVRISARPISSICS